MLQPMLMSGETIVHFCCRNAWAVNGVCWHLLWQWWLRAVRPTCLFLELPHGQLLNSFSLLKNTCRQLKITQQQTQANQLPAFNTSHWYGAGPTTAHRAWAWRTLANVAAL
jgi:hypothetical protein